MLNVPKINSHIRYSCIGIRNLLPKVRKGLSCHVIGSGSANDFREFGYIEYEAAGTGIRRGRSAQEKL